MNIHDGNPFQTYKRSNVHTNSFRMDFPKVALKEFVFQTCGLFNIVLKKILAGITINVR